MPARGEAARLSLIEAAAEEFGPHGYTAASTRAIADRAGQNIAAINYYFGGKEGLYQAVAETIASFLEAVHMPILAPVRAYLDGTAHTHAATEEHIVAILSALARIVFGTVDRTGVTLFVLREQANPTGAFETLYEGFMRPTHETLAALIALRRGASPNDTDIVLRAHAIVSQVVGFRALRTALLRRTGWSPKDHPTPDHVTQVLDVVVEHSLAAIRAGVPS